MVKLVGFYQPQYAHNPSYMYTQLIPHGGEVWKICWLRSYCCCTWTKKVPKKNNRVKPYNNIKFLLTWVRSTGQSRYFLCMEYNNMVTLFTNITHVNCIVEAIKIINKKINMKKKINIWKKMCCTHTTNFLLSKLRLHEVEHKASLCFKKSPPPLSFSPSFETL